MVLGGFIVFPLQSLWFLFLRVLCQHAKGSLFYENVLVLVLFSVHPATETKDSGEVTLVCVKF